MVNIVLEVRTAHLMKTATGCQMYGPNPCDWPAEWFDAVMLDFEERSRIEMLMRETAT